MLELYASAGIKKMDLYLNHTKNECIWYFLFLKDAFMHFYAFFLNKALLIEHWVFIKSDGAFPAMMTPIEWKFESTNAARQYYVLHNLIIWFENKKPWMD